MEKIEANRKTTIFALPLGFDTYPYNMLEESHILEHSKVTVQRVRNRHAKCVSSFFLSPNK